MQWQFQLFIFGREEILEEVIGEVMLARMVPGLWHVEGNLVSA